MTSIPSMAKIDAYSIPMTPPPTTVIARGRRFRRMMSSLVIATSPSSTAPGGVTARVPTATTIVAAAHRAGAGLRPDQEGVGILELRLAPDHGDVVAAELAVQHVDLPAGRRR